MRRVVYVVNGVAMVSYAEARKCQPTGNLETRLEEVKEDVKIDSELRAKRQACIVQRRLAKRNKEKGK